MEPQKPGNSPGPEPEVAKRLDLPKSERGKESVDGQMRSVLGQCPQALQEGFLILLGKYFLL